MIVALAGGVGGAKLADGLAQIAPEDLTVIVNTADDFEHYGLHISPDLDTVVYTLAGIANPETGWGLKDESWNMLDQLGRSGGAVWFKLGDRDIATHLVRTQRLRRGDRLTDVMRDLRARLGVRAEILPMTDARVGTIVRTAAGQLPFQEYFVGRRCEPVVTGFHFEGIERATVPAEIRAVLAGTRPSAVLIGPSNPYVSIDPILAVPGMRDLLKAAGVPIVALSPIIGGTAVKGPAAKMMRELGRTVSSVEIARHYSSLISGLVIDRGDAAEIPAIEALGVKVFAADTLMRDAADRRRVAQECLAFAQLLG